MFWYHKDPSSGAMMRSEFHSAIGPVPPKGYDNIKQAIKESPLHCDLDDINVSDIDKVNAIFNFSREKLLGNFDKISRISSKDFVSILMHVRNHITHDSTNSTKKELSMSELLATEDVFKVLFKLFPTRDQSIIDRFEEETKVAVFNEAVIGFSKEERETILSILYQANPSLHHTIEQHRIIEQPSPVISHQQDLKAIALLFVAEDYCRQIVKESSTMKVLEYDSSKDSDNKLTSTIIENFYSSFTSKGKSKSLFLKLGHVQTTRSSYVDSKDGFYSDSLLDIRGNPVPVTFDQDSIRRIFNIHRNDRKIIGGRDISQWVYLLIIK